MRALRPRLEQKAAPATPSTASSGSSPAYASLRTGGRFGQRCHPSLCASRTTRGNGLSIPATSKRSPPLCPCISARSCGSCPPTGWRKGEIPGPPGTASTCKAERSASMPTTRRPTRAASSRSRMVLRSPASLEERAKALRSDRAHVFHRTAAAWRIFTPPGTSRLRRSVGRICWLTICVVRRSATWCAPGSRSTWRCAGAATRPTACFDRYDIVSEADLREGRREGHRVPSGRENGQSGRKVVAIAEKREAATC